MPPTTIPDSPSSGGLSRRSLRSALWLAVFAAAVATACGSSGSNQSSTSTKETVASSSSSGSSAPGATSSVAAAGTIAIKGFGYVAPPSVPAGAQVSVTNSDPAEHTVTADANSAFNVEIPANGTATFTAPSQPGSYPFHCTYHPGMHGVLVVQ
jgi:plastocyanin